MLANLIQLYRHDLLEFRGYELSEHGTFVYRFLDHYWSEPGRGAPGRPGVPAGTVGLVLRLARENPP